MERITGRIPLGRPLPKAPPPRTGAAPLPPGGNDTRLLSARVGLDSSWLGARTIADGIAVDGTVGVERLALRVTGTERWRHIRGRLGEQDVSLECERVGDRIRVTGNVGEADVDLDAVPWTDSNQVNVTGHVGNDGVHLFAHRQIDGWVVTGYSGGRRVDLRDRDIEGRLGGLEPVHYLAPVLFRSTA